MDKLARVGLVCRGVLYGLIGVLAVQIALGDGGQEADKNGAIATVADLPFGAVLLWVMAGPDRGRQPGGGVRVRVHRAADPAAGRQEPVR
jgi:hypothetical protein